MDKQGVQVMKKYLVPVLFVLLLIFPADASAGSKTRAQVLNYLTSLPSQSDKKVLSGQRTGWLNDGTNGRDMYGNNIFGDIYANSGGKYPAILSAEIDYYRGYARTGQDYNLTRLKDHWNAGGLVELTWIASNPGNGNVWTYPPNSPVIDIADVYTPGNSTYDNFRIHMDHVAGALRLLQNDGVIVMFRPFIEMNGGNPLVNPTPSGNWWSGKDYTKFKNLWIYTHDYLTNTKGLTNIIWVYSVISWWGHELDYYPGTNYVDIVGYNYYPFGWDGNYDRFPWVEEYDSLLSLGKPFAFTELGQCPGDSSWEACGGKDTRNIINDIKANFPNTVYWLNWDDNWELGRQANLPQLFADPWVVNRADNPSSTETITWGSGQNKKLSTPARISIQ